MAMSKYWRGTTQDGKFVTEALGATWGTDKLQSLELVIEGKNQTISLPKGMEYVQAKTCSANLSDGICVVESRYIGFKLGNKTIIVRVDEKTDNISVEIS